MRLHSTATMVLVASAASLCGCAPVTPRADLLGTPAADSAPAQRTVVIMADTRFINVTSGETIRFVAGTRSFIWNFQTGATITSFDLNQVAPAGMLDRAIIVYVAINPLYISNS